AQDHARRDAIRIAHADERARDHVAGRDPPQPAQVRGFAFAGRQIERRPRSDVRRDGLIDERVERGHADGAEHVLALARVRADVTILEGTRGVESHDGSARTGADYLTRPVY